MEAHECSLSCTEQGRDYPRIYFEINACNNIVSTPREASFGASFSNPALFLCNPLHLHFYKQNNNNNNNNSYNMNKKINRLVPQVARWQTSLSHTVRNTCIL